MRVRHSLRSRYSTVKELIALDKEVKRLRQENEDLKVIRDYWVKSFRSLQRTNIALRSAHPSTYRDVT